MSRSIFYRLMLIAIYYEKITQIAYIIFLFFISCTKDENSSPVTKDFVSAVDISQYPEIASSNISFKDFNGNQKRLVGFT